MNVEHRTSNVERAMPLTRGSGLFRGLPVGQTPPPGRCLLVLMFLVAFVVPTLPLEAGTRVAVVTTESSPEIDQIVVLAETQIGSEAELELLDRKEVMKVLGEQKLALSGLVDPEQAIRAGKLLNVDLFAILECEPEHATPDGKKTKKKLLGLSALDSRSGVRLWDAPLSSEGVEETAAQIVAGVKGAAAKYRAPAKDLHTVGLLTVRNADLPRSQDPTIQAIGRLLERNLVRAPGVAVVERDRLRAVLQERNLPTQEPLPPLLASLHLIELEIGRNQDQGLLAQARVTDSAGKEVALLKATAADPFALATALVPEVLKALDVKNAGVALDRRKEADRYYAESWIRWLHKEYDRAAQAAEAVYALDPENSARLKWLIDRLAEAAIELIDPGQQQYAGPPKNPVDPAQLERSIELARHGLNLTGLFYQRVMRNPDWYRDRNGLNVMWNSIYLSKIVAFDEKTAPGSRELIAEFVGEYRDMQLNIYGRGLYEAAKAGRAFREYTSWVASGALLDIFHRFSKVRDDWPQDVADVLTKWAELADAQHPSKDRQLMRGCDYVLMTVRWSSQVPRLDAQKMQPLRDAFKLLESHSDPLLQLHGKLLAIYLDRWLNKLPEARARVPDLVAQVEPFAIAPDGPAQDAETRRRWIDMVLRANEVLSNEERGAANRKFYDLLESHGFYSQFAFFEASLNYRIEKKEEDLLAFLSRAITFLEKKPGGMTPEEQRTELPKLREWHRTLAESLGKATAAVAPWESVETLVDVAEEKTGIRSIVRPVVAGRLVFALGMDWDPPSKSVSFTLVRFNLDDKSREHLATYTLDNLEPATFEKRTRLEDGEINQLTTIERSTTEGSYFIRSACIAGDNYFAATLGRGIVVFPLKGGVPWRIDEASGLPSDFVQCLTTHNGNLYAWLGQPRKAAYLVHLKLDGTDIEVISSSRRTIQKTPLDNVAPVVYDFMTVDNERQRIVFRLTSTGSADSLGLWELSLATGAVRQLQRMHLVLSGLPPRLIAGDQILIKDGYVAQLFDMKTNKLHPLVRYEAQNPGLFTPITLLGDKVWVSYPFSSIDAKTRKIDLFPNLRGPGKTFQPGIFFEQTGDREFLLSDPAALWLIKMKPAAPVAPATP